MYLVIELFFEKQLPISGRDTTAETTGQVQRATRCPEGAEAAEAARLRESGNNGRHRSGQHRPPVPAEALHASAEQPRLPPASAAAAAEQQLRRHRVHGHDAAALQRLLPPAQPPGAQARERGAAGAADDGAAVRRAVHVVAAVVRGQRRGSAAVSVLLVAGAAADRVRSGGDHRLPEVQGGELRAGLSEGGDGQCHQVSGRAFLRLRANSMRKN
jgi:hypothetical protein